MITPTGGTRPPHWTTDVVDVVKATTLTTHDTAGTFVRWVIVLVSLFPMVVAVPAFINYGLAKVVVPVITLVVMISTVGLLAFKWNKVVAGLIELGITVEVLSRIELRRLSSLSTLAGVAKDFGSSAFRWSMKVIGLELLIGLYFSLVPVANERVLVLIALMLMSAMMALSLGGKKGLARLTTVALVVITGIFFAGGNDEALALIESGVSSASSAQQTAPVQQAGLLIVRKSVEEILHIPDGQETLELPLTVGQNTVRIALPANATDAEIETRPTDKPYMMCFEGKGCFVSNPGEHWDADFDFDTTIFWFQGVEPGVTMVITPIGR